MNQYAQRTSIYRTLAPFLPDAFTSKILATVLLTFIYWKLGGGEDGIISYEVPPWGEGSLSWWWVFSPVWIPGLIAVAGMVLSLVVQAVMKKKTANTNNKL